MKVFEVLKVSEVDLRVACAVRFTDSPAVDRVELILYSKSGASRAAIAVYGVGGLLAPPFEIGAADSIDVIAEIDLGGAGRDIDPRKASCPKAPLSLSGFGRPALLVLVRDSIAPAQDIFALISLDAHPVLLWREVARKRQMNGSGYDTFEVTLDKVADSPSVDIVLFQHALPTEGDRDYRPGPPLSLRFREQDGSYRAKR